MSLTGCVILDNAFRLVVTHLKNRGLTLALLASLDCYEIRAKETGDGG